MKHLWTLLTVVIVTTACTTPQHHEEEKTIQGRLAFEHLKYRDPQTNTIPAHIRSAELRYAASMPGSLRRLNKGDDLQSYGQFSQVGPYNIGGRTRAFVMDVRDTNLLLAGGISGGMWRSTDGGGTWSLTTAPDQLHNITCLAQDQRPGKENTWYYGTGEAWGNSAQITGNGMWKSTDNGQTWNVLTSTVSDRTPSSHAFAYTWRIVLDPIANRDIIYVATSRAGIQRSTDGGQTWQTALSSDAFFSDIAITPSGVLYATFSSFTGFSGQTAARYGVFRSVDGLTWENISPPNMTTSIRRGVIGVIPGTESFYVIAETPGSGTKGVFRLRTGDREEWHSLWRYDHGSKTWEDRSPNIPLFGGRNGDFFSQGGYDLLVAVSPHDTNVVVIGGTNLYLSTNSFTTPTQSSWIGGYGLPNQITLFPSWPNHHPDQHAVFFHPTLNNVLFSANDGGVMRTNDPFRDTVQWVDLNRGYYTTQFYAIDIKDTPGSDDVIGGMQDNGTWSTNSASPTSMWVTRNGGDGSYCYYLEDGSGLYVSSQQGRMRRVVLDAQGNETARTRIDPIGVGNDAYLFINPFVVDPTDERRIYLAGGTMLWRNNDVTLIPLGRDDSTSVNWDSLRTTKTSGAEISAIAACAVPQHRVYYGTTVGNMYRLDEAHQGDPIPVDITNGLSRGAYLNSITVDKRNGDHVYAVFSNYGVISLYASTNAGATWQAISGNLEENSNGGGNGPAVNWIDILPFDDSTDVYVVATSTGLYFTSELNGMSTVWTQVGAEEIGNVQTDMVLTRYADKRIAVGTHGRGVFYGTITSLPPRTTPPTLRSPANGARGIWPDTTLAWDAVDGAVSYAVELSTTEDFTTNVTRIDGLKATSTPVRDLTQGPVTYYWRVFAYAGGGKSEASSTWTFSTAVRPPDVVAPTNRQENVAGLPVSLTWSRIPEALSYDVEVATNLTFSTIVASASNVTDTTTSISGLASNTRYFWHVRSADADTFGIWCQRSQFTTGVLTSVQEDDVADQIKVVPDPANDHLVVTTETAQGVIEIVNIDGAIVFTTSVNTLSTRIDVRHLATGMYTLHHRDNTMVRSSSFRVVR